MVAVATVIALLASCSSVPRRIIPPQANLLELQVTDTTSSGRQFSFDLEILNLNAEEIPVTRLNYDIRLGPAGRVIGEHLTPFTLPPQDSEILTVSAFSDIVSSPSQLQAFADAEGRLDYELNGELVLGTRLREPVPIFQRGRVPLLVEITIR